jgi:hypothetical protein
MKEDPWHDKQEEFLRKIELQCNAYHGYFSKDYMYYHGLASKFNIPILVISSVNALTAISLNDFLGQRYVSILNAILSAGTGILGSIQLYMKINEKMANALRSGILMKRLALKISKELSIDREQRSTEGQAFLQDCFSEFNAALEQANPVEKKVTNFLAFTQAPEKAKMGFMDLVASISPRKSSFDEFSTGSTGSLQRLGEPRAKTLWGLLGTARRGAGSHHGSESPPDPTGSIPEEVPSLELGELRPIRGSLV